MKTKIILTVICIMFLSTTFTFAMGPDRKATNVDWQLEALQKDLVIARLSAMYLVCQDKLNGVENARIEKTIKVAQDALNNYLKTKSVKE